MAGLIVRASREGTSDDDRRSLLESINLGHRLRTVCARSREPFVAASWLAHAPLPGERISEDEEWVIAVAGDVVRQAEVPFDRILRCLTEADHGYFATLDGIFAIAAWNKKEQRLLIVTDRRGQFPVYYREDETGFLVSGDLASFCRIGSRRDLDEQWLWEFLYFNFPVSDATFLRDVRRLPAATVLHYDPQSRSLEQSSYAADFSVHEPLLEGRPALERAATVFAEVVPRYFEGTDSIACALTGGWDARTILAFAPHKERITTYTYGEAGCGDIRGATDTAAALGIRHRAIVLDDDFVRALPQLILESVYLSSGLERVSRASLLHTYRSLTADGSAFPLVVSGIALDMLFRGHANIPFLVPIDLARIFSGGEARIDAGVWRPTLGARVAAFAEHIGAQLNRLRERFGDPRSAAHHLSYIAYILSTRHFCGELAIARHFSTVRVPSWDQALLDLSYSIRQSTLSYSQFTDHKRGSRSEAVLQAFLLDKLQPRFADIPVSGIYPRSILRGEAFFQLDRVKRRVRGLVNRRPRGGKLEDNERWLNETHRSFVDSLLFANDAEIRQFVEERFLSEVSGTRDLRLIAWLLTIEITLRLARNGWQRFW